MRRRSFLLASGGGALVMLGPGWLRRAFGDASLKGATLTEDSRFGDLARRRALAGAKARALAAGRPLLVFIIPKDDRLKIDRGHAFGELLTHGTPAQLAPLASVELACATLDDLGASASGKEDAAVLARLDPRTSRLELIRPARPLPLLDPIERRMLDPDPPIDEDQYIENRIAALASLIEETLGPARSPQLGLKVANAFRGRPPAGTHWASESGCGPAYVEETPEERAARKAAEKRGQAFKDPRDVVGYDCGMGHVPDKSARFLYFFTNKPAGT
jgi:hypothetical protein